MALVPEAIDINGPNSSNNGPIPKAGKRNPGLKLTPQHLQLATNGPSSNNNNAYGNNNNNLREKIGHLMSSSTSSPTNNNTNNNINSNSNNNSNINNNSTVSHYYGGPPPVEEETSLAASYLAASKQQQQQQIQIQHHQYNKSPLEAHDNYNYNNNNNNYRPPPLNISSHSSPSLQTTHPTINNTSNNNTNIYNTYNNNNNNSNNNSNSNQYYKNNNNNPEIDPNIPHDVQAKDLEILKRLGEGAAGTVRKVLHKPTNLIMAKKSISTDPDPAVQKQILRELSFLKTCNSPYIVSFYGAFLDDGETTVSLCMEYCEAGSLQDIYTRAAERGGVIGEAVLERIAESVCKGLVYLHSKRVIHRDIKPSNIVVTRKGEIKLCDFGVSGELINSVAETFTGTQYYMAPERIQGNAYAVQSDIWSLGLTLIEVSQNEPALPPPGHPDLSIFELLDFIVRQPVPVIKGSHISDACKNFVAVCLTKDPYLRPTPATMLEHPFIKKWENCFVDIAQFAKDVWGW
ncbi:unnamed protein product [Cunninghamella blakesleeana]